MTENTDFKTWAIVEVMGHVEYAGYVTTETIAGPAMLRVDVPEVDGRAAFTKYFATNALYGISPCSEQTARARAGRNRSAPFQSWDIESQILDNLRSKGRLIDNKPDASDDEQPF